jgi:hypothetical protein
VDLFTATTIDRQVLKNWDIKHLNLEKKKLGYDGKLLVVIFVLGIITL